MSIENDPGGLDAYLSLTEAAAELPAKPHLSTLHRWFRRGVRGVRLRTCVIGGRRFTTREWLRDFINSTTSASESSSVPHKPALGGRTQSAESALRLIEREID